MFVIQETTVDESVADIKFACDLKACRGACCTMPGSRGAPLLDSEVDDIRRVFPVVKSYLSENHLRRIDEVGLVEGEAGDYSTPCYNQRACVFVTYEHGIAKCSFEKAFFEGKIAWRKPLSCHLFPLRIDHRGPDHVRFEFIPECLPALDKGNNEDIFLSDFVRDALLRSYGQSWYEQFIEACNFARDGKSVLDSKSASQL